jgi:hypothetical protein
MTAIIISILATLGIGGGVMLASSGGSGGGSSSAVVSTANPGGSSGGGGAVSVGNLITNNPNTLTTLGFISKDNTTVENNTFTIGLSAFVPVQQSENTYRTTEVTRTWYIEGDNEPYLFNYGNTPNIFTSFDLTNTFTDGNNNAEYTDFYAGNTQTMSIPILNGTYLYSNGYSNIGVFSNVILNNSTWSFTPTLALGGRKLGLTSSDFGYAKYKASFTGGTFTWTGGNQIQKIANFFERSGVQQFYLFDSSKQIMAAQYAQKYGNNTATFTGRTIGAIQDMNNGPCSGDVAKNVLGNISLTLNFANNTFTGDITNLKPYNLNTAVTLYNFALGGTINNVNSTSSNLTFTSVTPYGSATHGWGFMENYTAVRTLLNEGSNVFGHGVLVEGDNTDELVGEIAFIGTKDIAYGYFQGYHLAFGAKKN